ncbi:hypothetical protein BBJ28_00014304 [Nothophytophthora sp. Chile5]|nr:hypothetical protein BBJ28_00014304 [Nothophytophthora sp. Chile5]
MTSRSAAPAPAENASDSDDGFQDFLSEESEEDALQRQELAALERQMKTAGIRDGLELGKEDTLQEGFDSGFALGAARSYRFGVLRGALSAAVASGLFEEEDTVTEAQRCMVQLQLLARDTRVNEEAVATPETEGDGEVAVRQAHELLERIQLQLPPPPITGY